MRYTFLRDNFYLDFLPLMTGEDGALRLDFEDEVIAGACVGDSVSNPANECLACLPSLSTSAFSARARGVACNDDGSGITDDLQRYLGGAAVHHDRHTHGGLDGNRHAARRRQLRQRIAAIPGRAHPRR